MAIDKNVSELIYRLHGVLPPDSGSYDEPLPGTDDLFEFDIIPDKRVNMLHDLFIKDLRGVVASCLSGLKPEFRQIIQLIYFEGMSNKEAAAALGCTEERVYALEQGALRALRHPAISKRLAPYYLSRTIYENVW